MKTKLNELQKIMQTKIEIARNGKSIVPLATASASAKWLKKHKQTNSGKNYEEN